ncbi:hypothetical protein ACOCEA_04920 [Maribacter sp. CXY002]|uniref:hypothetical protein n=1 Tax=Maribacter luteocoastalis TaxID=3407671 RepID=UPI003B67F09A
MRLKLLLYSLLLISLKALCQETVFVKAIENGNGFTRQRNGECYIVTPNHVVLENLGGIEIVAKNRLQVNGRLIESFEPDLVIIKLEQSTGLTCKPIQRNEVLNEVLENVSTGYLEYRDEFGASNLIHVNITSIDQDSIAVIPQDPSQQFIKEMGGASLYVNHKADKILLGMLLHIEEDLKTAHVYQIDDINRMLSPFFDVHEDKTKSLGILILKDDAVFSEVSNTLASNLRRNKKCQVSKKIPDTEFLYKEFSSIVSNSFNKNIPQKIKEGLDEVLLGEVTILKSINAKNLYKINARLAANLYSSHDFTLIKNLNANGKGLNSDENLAYDQSIRSLLTNLENQLK